MNSSKIKLSDKISEKMKASIQTQLLWFFIWRNVLCFKNTLQPQGQVLESFQRYWMLFLNLFLPSVPECCFTGHLHIDLSPVNIWREITQLLRKPHPWTKSCFLDVHLCLCSSGTLNSFNTQHFIFFALQNSKWIFIVQGCKTDLVCSYLNSE